MSKIRDWAVGWVITRRIKRNNPALYRLLCEPFDPAGYEEISKGTLISKDALEAMRKLGEEEHRG